jgi:hypothetical protein
MVQTRSGQGTGEAKTAAPLELSIPVALLLLIPSDSLVQKDEAIWEFSVDFIDEVETSSAVHAS